MKNSWHHIKILDMESRGPHLITWAPIGPFQRTWALICETSAAGFIWSFLYWTHVDYYMWTHWDLCEDDMETKKSTERSCLHNKRVANFIIDYNCQRYMSYGVLLRGTPKRYMSWEPCSNTDGWSLERTSGKMSSAQGHLYSLERSVRRFE